MIFEFKILANKKIDGEFILRKQTKSVRPLFIFLALIPTVGSFINGSRFNMFQILIFWFIVIYDIIISLMTNKLKPIAIIVTGNNLLLNGRKSTNRNLCNLKTLTLNGLTDEIQMTFVNEKKLSIKRSEYLNSDIEKLIEICAERSKEQLSISDNLKK